MPNIPVRNLAAVGIVQDISPYELPPNGFSAGNNIRFENGKVTRAPIFRRVFEIDDAVTPVFSVGSTPNLSFDYMLFAGKNGKLFKWENEITSEVTDPAFLASDSDAPFTSTVLNEVQYVNRPSHVPQYYVSTNATAFALPNWDVNWRCASLRAFKDFLIAINVTEGATNYPTKVKWSDVVIGAAPPGSWDKSDITKNAGENVIAQLETPLVDGAPLGNNFILYSRDEVWLMEFVPTNDVFDFRGLFTDAGVINQNCIAEVDGKHYVFGPTDIYVHDGITKRSIADERVRVEFFRRINISRSNKFFVAHNPTLKEIEFCAVRSDDEARFKKTTYCNFAAVYNYQNNTWSYKDLPNVSSHCRANINTVMTWDEAAAKGLTWEQVGGAWADQEDSFVKQSCYTSVIDTTNSLTKSRMLVADFAERGSVARNFETETLVTAVAERTAIDLDEIRERIRDFKSIRAILPQVVIYNNQPLKIQIGYHETSSSPIIWETAVAFNPQTDYKINSRSNGRYLAWRLMMEAPSDFEASGFDLDVITLSRR